MEGTARQVWILRESRRLVEAFASLGERGWEVVVVEVAAVVAAPGSQLAEALSRLDHYHLLVLTSQEAVAQLSAQAQAMGISLAGFRGQVAAVGEATRRAAQAMGLAVAITPEQGFSQAGLIQALSQTALEGRRVLWPRGDRAAPALAEALRSQGAILEEVVVYRTEPRVLSAERRGDLREGQVRAVVYTAPSQVRFLCQQLDPLELEVLRETLAFSIGPETSRALSQWRINVAGEASPSSYAGLAELVSRRLGPILP
ncbi:MAG: uroporphyrinogen-III synthase [Firmicutes bacterium]|nr:uroporphyrinogen-III synthase [Bacillota bacterium]